MEKVILTEFKDQAFYITLNNPGKLNCMGMAMLNDLHDAVVHASENPEIRSVIIRGAGDRAFSTGANLKEFDALEGKEIESWISLGHKTFNLIEQLPKPTLAVIDGFAIGGGLELALACDLRLATENAIISSPELLHGWLPGWGGINRLKRLIGEAKTKVIIFTGAKINAHHANELGLFYKLCPKDQLEDEINTLVETLNQIKPEIFKLAKSAMMNETADTNTHQIDFDVLAAFFAKSKG